MSNKLYFKPWVGENYNASNPKIMVVGESHYNDAPVSESFTIEVVDEYVSGRWNHRFFTGISRVISGLSAWETHSKREQIWQNLAFYNYCLLYTSPSPRD